MAKRFYVDYGSVQESGMKGLSALDINDTVCVVLPDSATTMPTSLVKDICRCTCSVDVEECECDKDGKCSLQLASLIGRDATAHPKDSFRVVGKEPGYKQLVGFWRQRGADIQLSNDLTGGKAASATKSETKFSAIVVKVKKATAGLDLTSDDIESIASALDKYKTKASVNAAIQKRFSGAQTSQVYVAIKDLLPDQER